MSPPPPPFRDETVEVSDELIARARRGESLAREQLVEQSWRVLRRYAHGRLPKRLRPLYDTEDLVQSALFRALRGLGTFAPTGPGAFHGFVRRILQNRVIDLTRGARATHPHEPPSEQLSSRTPEPSDHATGAEVRQAYLDALDRLTPLQRSAVVMRFELGWSYAQIASELAIPSPNAARMCVLRGAAHLRRALRAFATAPTG